MHDLPLPKVRRKPGRKLPVAIDSDIDPKGCSLPELAFLVAWNGLTGIFVVKALLEGEFLVLLFLTLFVAVGVGLTWTTMKPYTRRLRRVPVVELEQESLNVGAQYKVMIGQPGPLAPIVYQVDYICRETVTYTVGTNNRTESLVLHEVQLLFDSFNQVSNGEPRWFTLKLEIPAHLPGSFESAHNRIEHFIQIHGNIPMFPDLNETFTLIVLPALGGPS